MCRTFMLWAEQHWCVADGTSQVVDEHAHDNDPFVYMRAHTTLCRKAA